MSGKATDGDKLLVLGVAGKAHGVRGEVRIRTFLADPQALGDYGPLATPDGKRLTVQQVRALKDGMAVARFAEIDDRTAAEALNGMELSVPRSALPDEEDEDSFYHADLIGLEARDPAGGLLGHIAAVHDFGAGDILEVRGPGGQSYYPFTKAIVPEIDVAHGRLTIVPPAEIGGKDG